MSLNITPITAAPYKIFAFLIGVHRRTGPRLISVHWRQPCAILPVIERDMFPEDANICATNTVVENRHYCVYFDRTNHQLDSKTASYLFIRILYPGRPVDICPEDDLPDIIESLKECVFLLPISRLEHGYTRGSQVRDPYPYPWDTHYPNTNAGLDTGTDPQMRVAVWKLMKTPAGVYPSAGTPAGTHDIAVQ